MLSSCGDQDCKAFFGYLNMEVVGVLSKASEWKADSVKKWEQRQRCFLVEARLGRGEKAQ